MMKSRCVWGLAVLVAALVGGCSGGRTGDLGNLQPGKTTECNKDLSSSAATPKTDNGERRHQRRGALRQAVNQATQQSSSSSVIQNRGGLSNVQTEVAGQSGPSR